MSKSGLTIQKERRGRKIFIVLTFLAAAAFGSYYLAEKYKVLDYFGSFFASLEQPMSLDSTGRGTIYDRNFKRLAVDRERVAVYVRTREITSAAQTAKDLNEILGLDEARLLEQLERGVLRQWIARDISQEQEEILKNRKLPGVYLQREIKRFYPYENLAAHLLGYVKDGIGLSGVEFYYDRLLANRKTLQQNAQEPLSRAQDLVLTVDMKIQVLVDELIREIQREGHLLRAAAYLLNGNTGEIIAGAQVPDFDPNTFEQYPQESFRNLFLSPMQLPDKFRLLIRDAAMLYNHGLEGQRTIPWSLVDQPADLGSQLRLWEWMGLGDPVSTDFYIGGDHASDVVTYFSLGRPGYPMGLIPEQTTPLNLLCGLSQILEKNPRLSPYVIEKIVDIESGQEVDLVGGVGMSRRHAESPPMDIPELPSYFHALAGQGPANSYLLSDSIGVEERSAAGVQLLSNEVTFVFLPTVNTTLGLLVVGQREVKLPSPKKVRDIEFVENIIKERLEKIAILQQVASSVKDVVEPEEAGNSNYRGVAESVLPSFQPGTHKEQVAPVKAKMPQLVGLSLRRSLQLLENIPVKIKIQGSGRVVAQKPEAGILVSTGDECVLVLESKKVVPIESVNLDKVE